MSNPKPNIGYARINNSFDGVGTLPIPTSGSVTSCSCEGCGYYNYDKRCNCYNGTQWAYDPNIAKIPESNDPMGCNLGNWECYDNVIYNNSKQPSLYEHPIDLRILNNNFGLDQSPGFYKIDKTNCDNVGYSTHGDARLIDAPRSIKLELDAKPYTGQVPILNINTIYDKQYQDFGKNYKNYRDINAGQYQYYYDKSISDPYFQPLYTIQSDVVHYMQKDPMDALKPYYSKRPLNHTLRNLSKDQFTRDTLSFREDLMSLQSGLMNRKNWSARWQSPAYTS